jgi:nitrite reductase/ring-hydroxylating ferredoxin subunit
MMLRPDEYVRVLPGDELSLGQMREIQVGSERLVVGRLHDGSVVAFGVECPHQGGRLADGNLRGNDVDCPLHHYLYDVHTGRNTFPLPIYPAWKRAQVGPLNVPIFPVIEEAGWIVVHPRPRPVEDP